MDYLLVAIASLLGAGLTLFSGFGLGTLLLAVLVFFFPPGIAVVVTAVVHFLNNAFKFVLLGRYANIAVVLRFGVPAILGAWLGAHSLALLIDLPAIRTYSIGDHEHVITPVKIAIGSLLMVFAFLELVPLARLASIPSRHLPLGGFLSGYFGGLSGHQGALRSMFLVKSDLTKESFIATGVVIALLVDVTRLSTYFSQLREFNWGDNATLISLATVSAFVGSFIGSRLLHKVTLKFIQRLVAILLTLISLGLLSGIL
ncbi:MAG: sulfite exporter TauE/SafE family protein [Proteobacteria bacterium]|nr:sulfite exporter TauE/SafE family protein [Pseudomonadota bacterium]